MDAFSSKKFGINNWNEKNKKINNIVWTDFQTTEEALSCITETFYLLTKRGLVQNFEIKNNTYRCKCRYGQGLKTTIELEVVNSKKKGIGIKRKRISGDSWAYINICKTIFMSCSVNLEIDH